MWGQFTVCQQSWSSQSWFTWIYSAIQSMDCDSFESLWPACCSFDCPDLTWSECSLNGLGLKIRSRVPFSLKSDQKIHHNQKIQIPLSCWAIYYNFRLYNFESVGSPCSSQYMTSSFVNRSLVIIFISSYTNDWWQRNPSSGDDTQIVWS